MVLQPYFKSAIFQQMIDSQHIKLIMHIHKDTDGKLICMTPLKKGQPREEDRYVGVRAAPVHPHIPSPLLEGSFFQRAHIC